MITATEAQTASTSHASSTRSRILSVVRLQYVNLTTFVWTPLMVMGGAFVISFAIYWMIGADEPMYGGGGQAVLWYFLVVGIQAMALTFPFSQALSLARWEFFLGTLVAAVVASLALALIYVLLGALEQATDGLGINGYMIYLPWMWSQGVVVYALLIFSLAMLFFLAGFWFSTLYRNLGATVLTAVLIGLSLLLLVAALIITRMQAWISLVTWVAELGPLTATGVIGLIIVVLAVGSWLTLRRSTP